ncbi:aromatic amino acid DMT transporter YddG [Bifidobacterium cuniculi]|uniref:Drug/metabolite exporter family transporter n=1 Tax=Bifidobacterium cuniculi TaxID=1688 RepID=A0A087B0J6_9BIFI|nr:aromatic amino acid DMT transporter YddG [Bifidobacterium cuniculi]KFI64546.1 drug/metabolite exporter family transporter [Bifidobacterium cuniculi]
MHSRRPFFCGIAALLCWSLTFGLLKLTLAAYGSILGAALVYTLGALGLFLVYRPDPLRAIPPRYLLTCGALFVGYEICMSMAVGHTRSQTQTLEISMLNYLWPILLAILCVVTMRRHRTSTFLRLIPGVAVAAVGILLAVGGRQIFGNGTPFAGAVANPLPYVLATAASLMWAVYSTLTPRWGASKNAVAYFFVAIAAVLWVTWLIELAQGEPMPTATQLAAGILPLVGGTVSLTAGYALWNYAITYGDLKALSTLSYASPILSTLATSILLRTMPSATFWTGAVLLVLGSLCCYAAMDRGSRLNEAEAVAATDGV